MNIIKTYTTNISDESGISHELIINLTADKGIYGFECTLLPSGETAADFNVTDSRIAAFELFDILCGNKVLPLNFYSVLDDTADMYI